MASIQEFLSHSQDEIIGCLSRASAHEGFFQQVHAQTRAWEVQLECLRAGLRSSQVTRVLPSDALFLEFPIPRRGKRADAIILSAGVVLVLEFKVGASNFTREARLQVEDYALDLGDFHAPSAGRPIVPILVATEAVSHVARSGFHLSPVRGVHCTGAMHLAQTLENALEEALRDGPLPISGRAWHNGEYRPTPTIVEAARSLYAGQNVREISRSEAGAQNLTRTTEAALSAVSHCAANRRKGICFITGVPGAGKTLAGLNIVHNPVLHEGDLGVFLSGNGPLVKVLREALARDKASRTGATLGEARREVATFVQNVHHYLDEYHGSDSAPVDKVVVFDEAQRAWNQAQSARKFHREFSEPEMMLRIMDRHEDWGVIIALVGGGQEINTGEAGLREWGRALAAGFPRWMVFVSHELAAGHQSTAGDTLFEEIPTGISVHEHADLHLRVPVRTYRAEWLAQFVEHILQGEPSQARALVGQHLQAYPMAMTRDLSQARRWVRARQRGTRRSGLVASSGARRIKPYGLQVAAELDACSWFLNSAWDVRSSCYLEDAATEFSIQGLELDWACVCWGADFRRSRASWQYRAFRGTEWQAVRSQERQRYILNKYRVLLTRAREGMIIWVPPGGAEDPTRLPEFYDGVAEYLEECGIWRAEAGPSA